MSNAQWQINGEYFEACSCDFVCPCPTSGLAAPPTKGFCDAGLVFHVDRGRYGAVALDDLSFAVLLHTPGPMIAWVARAQPRSRSGEPGLPIPVQLSPRRAAAQRKTPPGGGEFAWSVLHDAGRLVESQACGDAGSSEAGPTSKTGPATVSP